MERIEHYIISFIVKHRLVQNPQILCCHDFRIVDKISPSNIDLVREEIAKLTVAKDGRDLSLTKDNIIIISIVNYFNL